MPVIEKKSQAPKSEPTLSRFSPDVIPWQRTVIDLMDSFDYESHGVLEILLSGSYGSAKSVLAAHIVVTHCLMWPGARVAVGRRSMGDLRKTMWAEILEHIADDLVEGVDFWINRAEMKITFRNKAEIIGVSWADGKYKKFRSLKLSGLVIEEMTENDDDDEEAYKQLSARLNRIPGVPENFAIGCTNPDAPGHWVYRHFIAPNLNEQHDTRYVFYSLTEQNPFLPKSYVAKLLKDLPPKEAERYLRGRWIELRSDVIYCEYKSAEQFRNKTEYKVDASLPVHISFDFNIGAGKPMSCCLFQYVEQDDTFHFFAEAVIEGARTADVIDDLDSRGWLRTDWQYIVNGDAAGKARDTRSTRSDYDIIIKELANRDLKVTLDVPPANPPVRTRHNRVNAYCRNSLNAVRLYVYAGCVKTDEALRLTRLVKSGQYIEDDSKDYQHIGTSLGYGLVSTLVRAARKPQGTKLL